MMIPNWAFVLAGAAAYFFYWVGHFRGEREIKRREAMVLPGGTSPPQRVSYDVTINFAGNPSDHPDLRADIVKVIESAIKEGGAS